MSDEDDDAVEKLFDEFLDALVIVKKGETYGRKSPVGVAKGLHLLAPHFFPLWDQFIARAYGCYYSSFPALKYCTFSYLMALMSIKIQDYLSSNQISVLKQIDMYNYATYTIPNLKAKKIIPPT